MMLLTGDPVTERYELTLAVTPADIDVMEHVNNTVYVRWVQEAAVAHWTAAASAEHQQQVAWLVVRHELDYLRSARAGDTILLRTWVGSTVKHFFERFTEVLRASDGTVLARARTLWCPVDRTTLRPVRVDAEIIQRWSVPPAALP